MSGAWVITGRVATVEFLNRAHRRRAFGQFGRAHDLAVFSRPILCILSRKLRAISRKTRCSANHGVS